MHILLIHQAFASINEPGGTRHFEIARFLARRGYQITIIASPISYLTGKETLPFSRGASIEVPEPGINILRAYTYSALHKSFFHRIFSFLSFMISSFLNGLAVKNVDLVWGTSPPIFQGAAAWLLARVKRVPFLFEVRDLWPAFAIAIGVLRNRFLIFLSEWLEKFLYTHADQIIINSPGFRNHVESRGEKSVKLIPNGVDLEMFNAVLDQNICKKRLGFKESDFLVLYAGAHGISNDLEVVLDAARIIKTEENIKILLVGDGKEKQNLKAKAALLGLNNVFFLPSMPKNEMPDLISASNACIAILKPLDMYKTTYPNKVFDYMACAKPVILAIDGVIREVVEEAQGGIFVPPGDSLAMSQAIRYLRDHPLESEQMGFSGKKYIGKFFNRDKLSEEFLLIVQEMVQDERKDTRR